jgi:hypothetical protein
MGGIAHVFFLIVSLPPAVRRFSLNEDMGGPRGPPMPRVFRRAHAGDRPDRRELCIGKQNFARCAVEKVQEVKVAWRVLRLNSRVRSRALDFVGSALRTTVPPVPSPAVRRTAIPPVRAAAALFPEKFSSALRTVFSGVQATVRSADPTRIAHGYLLTAKSM